MKKLINTVYHDSLIFFVISVMALISFQYLVFEELKINDETKMVTHIKNTNDIEKLRSFALLLAEADKDITIAVNEVLYLIRISLICFTLFSVVSLFNAYRMRKNFLTSSSSGTGNP